VSAGLHRISDLVARGFVEKASAAGLEAIVERYALSITPAMADIIDHDDPHDPIARQFIPDLRESDTRPEELADPIGDGVHSPIEGIVHRYSDRVLLKLLHVCPVYCRFCFRREMVGPGAEQVLSPAALDAALDYIRHHSEIWEVILTGGDPLALSARRLADVLQQIDQIAHVKIVRIHTRVPAVDPARLDERMIDALRATKKTLYVALHANHPRELGANAQEALARLVDAGIPLVSQTVLLRGVNDDFDTLAALMRRFVELRVKPYYLHQADLAPGTAHFRVGLDEARALVGELRAKVSGLCQPTFVLDIPGGFGKVPVGPDHLTGAGVKDHQGETHAYPAPAPGKPDF
jgi:lysine 2,3-aminomutase